MGHRPDHVLATATNAVPRNYLGLLGLAAALCRYKRFLELTNRTPSQSLRRSRHPVRCCYGWSGSGARATVIHGTAR